MLNDSFLTGLGALFSFLNFTIVGSLQLNTYTTAGHVSSLPCLSFHFHP
jgi:hypothetical protein